MAETDCKLNCLICPEDHCKEYGYEVYRFPCDSAVADEWYNLVKVGRVTDPALSPTDGICSRHFPPNSFVIGDDGTKILHGNALPVVEFYLSTEDVEENFGNVPVVIKGCLSSWPASSWTVQGLASQLQDLKIIFRLGLQEEKGVQFETGCTYVEGTLQNYCDWLKNSSDLHNEGSSNPLADYSHEKYWCYADYKYMKDLFSEHPHMFKEVDWSTLGLPGRDSYESTLWIGSSGCYTVAHYDSYGCNLVAQISGKKRWILFPPEQSSCLYPTRVPYEESSVFSQVNISLPDLTSHSKYQLATPYVVDLNPGEVLYVPRHWWHYVECLEPAISVNTWIPLDVDEDERMLEAVTRFLMGKFITPENRFCMLNPTQDIATQAEGDNINLVFLNNCLMSCFTSGAASRLSQETFETSPSEKRRRTALSGAADICKDCEVAHQVFPRYRVQLQPQTLAKYEKCAVSYHTFEQYLQVIGHVTASEQYEIVSSNTHEAEGEEQPSANKASHVSGTDVINACLSRDVIQMMCSKLSEICSFK